VPGDPKFDNVLVTRFISALMGRGKRSLAERQFYGAMSILEEKTGQDAMTVLKSAMTNVKPVLEVKSRRVGGANYQVPVEVRPDRRIARAHTRWRRPTRPSPTIAGRFRSPLAAKAGFGAGLGRTRSSEHCRARPPPPRVNQRSITALSTTERQVVLARHDTRFR